MCVCVCESLAGVKSRNNQPGYVLSEGSKGGSISFLAWVVWENSVLSGCRTKIPIFLLAVRGCRIPWLTASFLHLQSLEQCESLSCFEFLLFCLLIFLAYLSDLVRKGTLLLRAHMIRLNLKVQMISYPKALDLNHICKVPFTM